MASNREPTPTKRTGGRPRQGIVALSSAAVLAIYSAGYAATSGAARRFEEQDTARAKARPAVAAFTPVTPGPAAPLPPVPRSPQTKLASPVAPPHESPSITPDPLAVAAIPGASEPATDLTALVAPVPAATPAAAAQPMAPTAAATPAVPPYKDGTYSGWGSSRHGDIQAEVVIAQGRIASARIQQCLTRYSCSWIAALPGQVVSRQSADVDYISGATQSSDAFYYAIAEALKAAVAP